MSQNSESQTLDAIKRAPGLSAVEIGKLCHPRIALNTVEKNVCHIREKLGKNCIETIMKTVVVEGVATEIATYYWRERDEKKSQKQKYQEEYEALCKEYAEAPTERKLEILRQRRNEMPGNHRQREAIETQINCLLSKNK